LVQFHTAHTAHGHRFAHYAAHTRCRGSVRLQFCRLRLAPGSFLPAVRHSFMPPPRRFKVLVRLVRGTCCRGYRAERPRTAPRAVCNGPVLPLPPYRAAMTARRLHRAYTTHRFILPHPTFVRTHWFPPRFWMVSTQRQADARGCRSAHGFKLPFAAPSLTQPLRLTRVVLGLMPRRYGSATAPLLRVGLTYLQHVAATPWLL